MTRKNYRNSLLLILITLAVLAGFVGCTEGPMGIFADIAAESDIGKDRTDDFSGANSSFAGRIGSNNYYAIVGTGRLYESAVNGSWNRSTLPAISDTFAQSAAVTSTDLYVVFGLSNPVVYSYNGTAWTPITFNPALSDEKIVRVLAAEDDQVFAITEHILAGDRTGKYSIYSFNGTDFDFEEYDGSGIGFEISLPNSVTVNAGTYWFDAGAKAISGTLGSLAQTSAPPPYKTTGVAFHAGKAYFTSSEGRIITTTDGTAWASSAMFESSTDVEINFTVPRIVDSNGTDVLLAGTTSVAGESIGSGYLELDPGTLAEYSTRVISSITNYNTSLNGKSVLGMPTYTEGTGYRVFGLTTNDGLWSNYFNGTTWSGWARE
jgi:hypothetical protein